MLHVHHSNRVERLLDQLIAVTAAALPDPFTAEVVVTQSQGMARWLTLEIAERRGVAALIDFVLPAAFVWRLFHAQLPEVPESSAFDREVLTWRLMGLLPGLLDRPGFEPLARYVGGTRPERRLFQLCRRVADLFDQYLVYRHELLLAWEAGEESDWQAQLWRALTEGAPVHRARLLERYLALAREGALDRARLPARVCVFGIATLPPAYLEVLARLAECTEVHLFLHNPCLAYWGEIADPKSIARRRLRAPEADEDYRESGNRLLASWGRQGRDFIDALYAYHLDELELFEPPEPDTLLHRLQHDILMLEERALAGADCDDSVQIHVCHSPMREVEVLHDQLLALFDADPTLTPRDVVVMAPDIELYAPCIEAVFGAAPEGRALPFAIADRSRRSAQPLVQAFLTLLDIGQSRYTASEILALLEVPAVARRFGLDEEALETLRTWVRDANIRWGVDAPARARHGLPATGHHTWEFGLRRLFLGYALPEREALFGGVLPYPYIEGQAAAHLGRLQEFLDALRALERRLAHPHQAAQWTALLHAILEGFFDAEGDEAAPLFSVRDAVSAQSEEIERAGYTAPFGVDVLADDLRARLAEPAGSQNFLSGRITFCAMLPMRSLPFRVICIVGLSDAAFPRRARPLGADRMANEPRRGDRSRREDDRYLFLEALLSARERLYLSYVGRSQRDNSPLLPSILVSELTDYLRAGLGEAAGALVTEHPLQPFSPRYFGAGPLFSYAAEWLAAQREPAAPQPFCAAPLPAPAEQSEVVELAALMRFFQDPARAFLRERLGIRLEALEAALQDDEPFALERRTRRELAEEALERLYGGDSLDNHVARVAARGALPEGRFGTLAIEETVDGVAALAEEFRRLASDTLRCEIDLALGRWRLVGWLDGVGPAGLLRCRVESPRARDRLAFYIGHLALCASTGPRRSLFLSRDERFALGPAEDAAARLETLVDLFALGHTRPLPFFPRSAEALTRPAGPRVRTTPQQRARSVWEGGDFSTGEREGPWVRIAWRDVENPLGEEFEEIARQVMGPMWECVENG